MMNHMKIAYDAIINNAQVSGTGKKINAVIPVDMIEADPLYQRIEGRNERKLRTLFTTWNDSLMDAIKVVPHPETYNFFVVDGLGRLTIAREKNFEEIDCVIIYGPEDVEERRRFEAKIFLDQATATDPIKPALKHNALVINGDPIAIAIKEMCEKYGVSILTTKGYREPKTLGSYANTYHNTEKKGKNALGFAFDVIDKSGYDLESNGYNSGLVEALMYIHDGYKDITSDFIGGYLRNMTPTILKARAVAKYPERTGNSGKVAILLFLQDYIIENYNNMPAVFDERGKKVIELKSA